MNSRLLAKRIVLAAILVLSSYCPAQSAIQTWVGGTSSDLLDANNWSGLAVPAAVDSADFINNASVNPNPNIDGLWNPKFIKFGDETLGSHTAGEGGPARNFTGTGTITVATAGNIDTWLASGDITFNNMDLQLTRSAGLTVASGTDGLGADGASNLIINTTTFRAGVGSGGGSPTFSARGGNLTVMPAVDFSTSTANRNLILAPFAGRSISLVNGVVDTPFLVGIRVQGSGGKVSLGDLTTWNGNIGIMGSDLEINQATGLGAAGTRTDLNYTQIQSGTGGAAAGALVLANNISIGEYFYLDVRSDFNAQIKSKSGANTLTNTIELENGNAPVIAQNHYALQSDGTAGGDLLTISGDIQYSTEEDFPLGSIELGLQGAGNGVVSGSIGGAAGAGSFVATINVVKNGGGKWTLASSANSYTGTTTVNAGTLALSTTGTVVTSTQIDIKAGATFDVSAQAGFTIGSAAPQTIKGDGTVVGNVTIAAGSTLAVDYNGSAIDSLAISGVLNITTAILDFNGLGDPLASGAHVIATYGSLVGATFASVVDLPIGFSIDYHYLGNQIAVVSATPGDFDSDGDVDGADFVAWQTHYPMIGTGTLATGDANGDGNVDGADLAVWQGHFPTSPGATTAVPEPAAILLATFGLVGLCLYFRRPR